MTRRSCKLLRRFAYLSLLLTAAAALALEPVLVAPDVYAFIGDLGEIRPENRGNVGNTGFIVGADGIIVVDTGVSYRYGREMLEAIATVSDKPVRLVINTHAAQEFVFGNAAFAERGVPALAHAKTVELMRQRCGRCLEELHKALGEEAMRDTRLVFPERVVEDSIELTIAGRTLDLLYLGWASTPGDLAVFDRTSGTLFAGGVVAAARIPELRDANLDGWLGALAVLETLPIQRMVPGHGPAVGSASVATTRAYLLALDAKVGDLYRAGASLMEAVDAADLPDYASWGMYPFMHRKNALHRYLQLELQDLGG